MRKITIEAVRAFENAYRFKQGNTQVKIYTRDGITETHLLLHGNSIAIRTDSGLFIQDCGWQSNTTKERLNGLNGVTIIQKDFQWYLNGTAWNGASMLVMAAIG